MGQEWENEIVKSRLITAWILSTAVAVTLAYQAVGLVQTQVTEGAPVLAAFEAASTASKNTNG